METLGRCGDFKKGEQVIGADYLLLLVKGEKVLTGVVDRLVKSRRCYWIGDVCGQNNAFRISGQPSPIQDTLDQIKMRMLSRIVCKKLTLLLRKSPEEGNFQLFCCGSFKS